MTIPEPLRLLFDTFPISQLPSVVQHTAQEKVALEKRQYRYSQRRSASPLTKFTVCVHNVYKADDNSYLATDPLCLTVQLAMCLKLDVSIPKVNHDHLDKSRDLLFVVNHHACEQLPLYLEDEDGSSKHQVVRDYNYLQDSLIQSLVTSSTELMLITLVDCVLYDSWVTTLLFEMDSKQLCSMYIHDITANHTFVNSLSLPQLSHSLIHRNGFNLRNPHITKLYDSIYTWRTDKYVSFEKERNLRELHHALENLETILSKKNSDFFHIKTSDKDKSIGLLDVKLASYITLCEQFMEGTTMYNTLLGHHLLREHARQVVKQCS